MRNHTMPLTDAYMTELADGMTPRWPDAMAELLARGDVERATSLAYAVVRGRLADVDILADVLCLESALDMTRTVA